jgi:signal transduction histidine kinase/AmiR/NasT family two-component response regulator
MVIPSVFADPEERDSLGPPPDRRRRRSGPRLWQLIVFAAVLLGFVLVVVLHGHGSLADSLVVADRAQQARQVLSLPDEPDADGAPLSRAGETMLAAGGWLGACRFARDAVIRSVALSPSWTAGDCPARPADLSAADGAFTTLPLGQGRHAVWRLGVQGGQGGATAVALVFDTAAASGAIEQALRQSAASRAWIIAVLLTLTVAVLLPQAQALARLYGSPAPAGAARRGGRASASLGGVWVCEELLRLQERFLEILSERRRQDVRTNEALELLRQTWHFGSEAVVIVDAHGVVSYVNPAAQALLRGGAGTLLGLDIGRLLASTSVESLTVRAGGSEQDNWAVPLVRPDGTTVLADALVTLCAIEEQPIFQIFLKPQVAAPAAVASAPAAASASGTAPERLIANVSHEIRTPLNGIIGMTDLLADTPLLPDQKEILSTLRTSTRQLRALLNDILDAGKSEAGQLRMENIPFDVCAQVKRCVDAFQAVARNKGIKLSLQSEVPVLVVMGDPLRVGQVLNNLLDNAVKFTSEGTVRVRLAVEAAPGQGADLRLRLEVSDTGIGVAAGLETGIFEPYRQADSSTTRQYGGSGLGLSLCRDLCSAMNGGIALQPGRGKGSTFSVWLDLRRGEVAKSFVDTLPFEWADAEPALKGCRALVADDNRINQMLLTRWLQHEGVEVELAVDGEQAVRRAAEGGLDIILMDLSMPVMNGLDATRTIRQLAGKSSSRRTELATLPIIGVTAHALPGDREACMNSGMNEYITKPLKRHELIQIMVSAVRRHNEGAQSHAIRASSK